MFEVKLNVHIRVYMYIGTRNIVHSYDNRTAG